MMQPGGANKVNNLMEQEEALNEKILQIQKDMAELTKRKQDILNQGTIQCVNHYHYLQIQQNGFFNVTLHPIMNQSL